MNENVIVPMISYRKVNDNEYVLMGLSGPQRIFTRLGEFLCVMNGDDYYYLNEIMDPEDLTKNKVYEVHLEPFEDGREDHEETVVDECDAKDLDESGACVDQTKIID